jgi:hypothetical protein
MRRDLADKANLSELLELKSKVYTQLEQKVDLKEVQTVLNQCQNEICEQLADFKKSTKSDILSVETDVFKMLERKSNILDV